MSVYDQQIAAANLSAAMQTPEIVNEIFQSVVERSAFLTRARRLPNMGTGTANMSVMNALPLAFFQATGTSLKKTTKLAWKGKILTVADMAVIVPIGENVLADATNINVWEETTPRIGEAMGAVLDAAIFGGVNLPSTWLTNTSGVSASIIAGAIAASMTVEAGTGVDLYDDIYGDGGTLSLVEAQGFDVNGHVAPITTKGKLRHVRVERTATGAGVPLLWRENGQYMLDSVPVAFVKNGAVDPDDAMLISGDWDQVVYSIRQDITPKFLDQAVIQDAEGDIIFNLAQEDMVAIRFTFRLAVQIANPVTMLSQTESARYPFAVLTPAAGT